MQASLLIKNAEIIFPDEGRVNKGSLAVAEGKIYLVENLPDIHADTVIDASGLFVLQLSWNINFGRKQNGTQKRLNNSDTDAGIMKVSK